MIRMEGMLVAWLTIARRLREAIEVDDADGTGMLSSRRFETEHCVDEAPVAVEEGVACVDEMLQNGEDMREGSGVTGEGSEGGCCQLVHVLPIVLTSVDDQWCEVLKV